MFVLFFFCFSGAFFVLCVFMFVVFFCGGLLCFSGAFFVLCVFMFVLSGAIFALCVSMFVLFFVVVCFQNRPRRVQFRHGKQRRVSSSSFQELRDLAGCQVPQNKLR